MNSANQTARFAKVIEECGKPKFVSLWGKPDAAFLQAAKQRRVMTIKTHPAGNKAEFGLVGFHKDKNALYLLFPKPLSKFEEQRIIGINLDLVEEEGVTSKSPLRRTATKQTRKPIPSPEKRFTVVIRSTAIVDALYDINARNKKTAAVNALEAAERESIDFLKGEIKRTIIQIRTE